MNQMDQFKQDIEAMFQKSFKEIEQKNNLNKTYKLVQQHRILNNLVNAAQQQSNRINELDSSLENLKKSVSNEVQPANKLKSDMTKQEQGIKDNFDKMMYRLTQIEEGINNSRRNMQKNLRINQQSEHKMGELIRHLEKMQRQQNIPTYQGDKNKLYQEMQDFERMLMEENNNDANLRNNVQFNKKTLTEPIQTFETKLALQNRGNSDKLKDKLREFTDIIKQLEKRVQDTSRVMSTEMNKSAKQQQKIVNEMMNMQQQMGKFRVQLQESDLRWKQKMQSNAATLDNMVEQMLVEAKKLQVRVQTLKSKYQIQNQKLRQGVPIFKK